MIINILYAATAFSVLLGVLIFFYAQYQLSNARRLLSASKDKVNNDRREFENERRENQLKIKDEIYRRRKDFEFEIKKERSEVDRLRNRLNSKVDDLEKKESRIDDIRHELQQKERELLRSMDTLHLNENKLKKIYDDLITKLESIGSMSKDEARNALLDTLEGEVRLANEKWVQKMEDEARERAKERASDIVVTAMQRYTSDLITPYSSGVVQLPNDEMKGRIIGKEGRNIKSLEMATGMEFVIGDAPEVITISGFNPIRREVARRSLEKLIVDGRINPTRIEDTVAQCESEINDIIEEKGRETILEYNLQGVAPEVVTTLGKLYFRTSYSQNVLKHSIEVGLFSRMIADELSLDGEVAFRGGLFHDLGKAVTAEVEGPHALIGADIAKRGGEDPRVINAIAAHHEEVPFTSVYSPIILIADMISASRPGARRETFSAYIKRLEQLEDIAHSFDGVKKAYALQAGREVRIMVEEEYLDDEKTSILARDIARKIEADMNFPGQIRVNVIREKRAIEYAR
ncbi:ribonuclease Y [bacterium]|jgi:ribonucrease Y|nr:ribonuclease Y [bacterium]MBT5015504.1 ribonuclease Y [bacterium]